MSYKSRQCISLRVCDELELRLKSHWIPLSFPCPLSLVSPPCWAWVVQEPLLLPFSLSPYWVTALFQCFSACSGSVSVFLLGYLFLLPFLSSLFPFELSQVLLHPHQPSARIAWLSARWEVLVVWSSSHWDQPLWAVDINTPHFPINGDTTSLIQLSTAATEKLLNSGLPRHCSKHPDSHCHLRLKKPPTKPQNPHQTQLFPPLKKTRKADWKRILVQCFLFYWGSLFISVSFDDSCFRYKLYHIALCCKKMLVRNAGTKSWLNCLWWQRLLFSMSAIWKHIPLEGSRYPWNGNPTPALLGLLSIFQLKDRFWFI